MGTLRQAPCMTSTTRETSGIKVFTRVRNFAQSRVDNDSQDDHCVLKVIPPAALQAQTPRQGERLFEFESVIGPEISQKDVFDTAAEPMLERFVTGHNCTLFAYGQTGTGKTWTISGGNSEEDEGIIPRTFRALFSKWLARKKIEGIVGLQYVELYNEKLHDLLAPGRNVGVREISREPGQSTEKRVELTGAHTVYLTNADDALDALRRADQRRHVASTKMNRISSRSHAILIINLDAGSGDMLTRSKFNIVDLAGSENIGRSGAKHATAREAMLINQTLLTLGRVIEALAPISNGSQQGSLQHVPYRDSVLTRLLQDSLGGATCTAMIATVSSAFSDLTETLSTLKYASRVRQIRNRPQLAPEMVARHTVLSELGQSLAKMQSDLNTQRYRDGAVYLSLERLEELQQATGQLSALRQQAQLVDQVREQLSESQERERQTSAQLAETQEALGVQRDMLSNAAASNTQLRRAVDELAKSSKSHATDLRELGAKCSTAIESALAPIEQVLESATIENAAYLAEAATKSKLSCRVEIARIVEETETAVAQQFNAAKRDFGIIYSQFDHLFKMMSDTSLQLRGYVHSADDVLRATNERRQCALNAQRVRQKAELKRLEEERNLLKRLHELSQERGADLESETPLSEKDNKDVSEIWSPVINLVDSLGSMASTQLPPMPETKFHLGSTNIQIPAVVDRTVGEMQQLAADVVKSSMASTLDKAAVAACQATSDMKLVLEDAHLQGHSLQQNAYALRSQVEEQLFSEANMEEGGSPIKTCPLPLPSLLLDKENQSLPSISPVGDGRITKRPGRSFLPSTSRIRSPRKPTAAARSRSTRY